MSKFWFKLIFAFRDFIIRPYMVSRFNTELKHHRTTNMTHQQRNRLWQLFRSILLIINLEYALSLTFSQMNKGTGKLIKDMCTVKTLDQSASPQSDQSPECCSHEMSCRMTNPITVVTGQQELSQDSIAHLNWALPIKLKFFSEQKIKEKITGLWNIDHCDLNLFLYYTDSFPKVWHSSIKYYLRYKAKSLDCEKHRFLWPTFFFWSKVTPLWFIIT